MTTRKGEIYLDNLGKTATYTRDKRMSNVHVYMVWKCATWLGKSKEFRNSGGTTVSIIAIKNLTTDRVYPDVETELFDIECETGLKNHYDDLKDRITRNPKTVIVVLPNRQVKARYEKNCKVRKQRLQFCTISEFPKTVHLVLSSMRAVKWNREKRQTQSTF